MATYLLTWNPTHFLWEDLQECIKQVRETGSYQDRWSCSNTKKIQEGDRFFLIQLGVEPRGIFASGWVLSAPELDSHWSEEGKSARYIDIEFNVLLNPKEEPILPRALLDRGHLAGVKWSTQRSGITIPDHIAVELEKEWASLLDDASPLPEEVQDSQTYQEGATTQITVNTYERSKAAREACVRHHGARCFICKFDFEKTYGSIGKNVIHVHHLNPLSARREEYRLDPIHDLRPVCPNCHTIIHRRNPPYTIEEVQQFLTSNTSNWVMK